MSDFTETLTKIEAIENTHERVDVSNFYVSNHLRENDCCIPSEDWEMILYYDYDPWCLIMDITEHWTPELKRKVAKIWWEKFEEVDIDDYGNIRLDFMFWETGTDQFNIMEAFKDFFGIDVIEDKDFMGMVGFINGDYLVNTLKRNQEEKEMTREKETTIYFADGREANIYRYKPNEYCIEFNDTGSREYGSYSEIVKMLEDYKTKITDANKKDDEENHPMTSVGTYINFWNTYGNYDVFVILNEAETVEHFETIMDNNVEDICHSIMQNNNLSIEGKKRAIETIFNKFTDYGVQIFINPIKKEDKK